MADQIFHYGPMLLGVFLIVLGCSFAYKFFLASVLGRLSYWTGFLPFTIVSPFIVHLPGGKRSLVKRAEGLWVHILMGPIFLICSVLCIAAGADYLGLPGIDTLNYVLNGGDISKPICVMFDKPHFRYTFPLLVRANTKIGKMISNWKIEEKEKDKLLHDNNESYAQQQPK